MKLEEAQNMLKLPAEIDYIIMNKQTCPEWGQIEEQKKALEKTDSLAKANKELERRLDFLGHDLKILQEDKK